MQFTEGVCVIGIGEDETNFVGSVTEVAVMITVLPLGMAAGAVYVIGMPLNPVPANSPH